MLTIAASRPVIEMHETYRYTDDGEPLPAGERPCVITIHSSPLDGHQVLVDVPTDRAIPDGWRPASPDEVAALTAPEGHSLMSTVQDAPADRPSLTPLADADRTREIPPLADNTATERLHGVTEELARILATEDAPMPPQPSVDGVVWPPSAPEPVADQPQADIHDLIEASSLGHAEPLAVEQALAEDALTAPLAEQDVEAIAPDRDEADWLAIDQLYRLGGSLLAGAQRLSVIEGLPVGVLTGPAGAPRMLVEVTVGSDLERRAEVDRVAVLLGVEAAPDYFDIELHAVYAAQRRFGGFLYRVETVITPEPIAIEARDSEIVDARLAVPGALPPVRLDGAVPAAGVPAPRLVGAR